MANAKIRLTQLWTDEFVMRDDFARGISEGMTAWAEKFYKRFDFDLDVEPLAGDRKSVAKAARFALRKNGGIRPDLRDSDAILASDDQRTTELKRAIDLASKRSRTTKQQYEADLAEINSLTARLQVLAGQLASATGPALTALIDEMDRIGVRLDSRRVEFDNHLKLHVRWERSRLSLELALAEHKTARIMNAIGDPDLRSDMSRKFLTARIGSETRLNVVFYSSANLLSMRKSSAKYRTLGITMSQLAGPLIAFRKFILWPYPYVLVDIEGGDRTTMAHEIVHAAGHVHPDAKTIIKEYGRPGAGISHEHGIPLADPIEGDLELVGMGSPGVKLGSPRPFLEVPEVVPGGFFDGPKTDIMNDHLNDPEPHVPSLSPADKALLDVAFFVRQPLKLPGVPGTVTIPD